MNSCGDCGSCNLCGPFNFDKKKGNTALVIGIINILLVIISLALFIFNISVSLVISIVILILALIALFLAKKERKYYPRKINRYAIYLCIFNIPASLIIILLNLTA